MKLINKDTIVAEIERRKQTWQHQDQQYVNGGRDVCDYLLGFLDTLEVKDVDLEKELDSQIRLVYGVKTLEDSKGFWGVHYDELARFSKHFFELGLKAQKGE